MPTQALVAARESRQSFALGAVAGALVEATVRVAKLRGDKVAEGATPKKISVEGPSGA